MPGRSVQWGLSEVCVEQASNYVRWMYREITELQPHLEEALGGNLSGVPIEIGRTHGGLTM